jgi:D-glycero-D-manno-heptose 1,7-bisphosphate phosphatase
MVRAVFLDRDGTIIEDTGYVAGKDRVKFLPGTAEAIRRLNENGFKVIVVSNQAGVARGYFDEAAVKETNEYIREVLARQGARIDAFYYCPHHVDGIIEVYRRDCYYRKPNPGMIIKAGRDFTVDLTESFVIGDQISDIEAGRQACCQAILLSDEKVDNCPYFTARDLPGAVTLILKFTSMVVTYINEQR